MNVTIFGASGGTGHLLAEKVLTGGHSVTAVVRDAGKFDLAGRCRVVTGDARDAGVVSAAVSGADAVFSTLGAKSPFEKSDLLARAVPLIVSAMQTQGVSRLIVLGAGGWQDGATARMSAFKRALLSLGSKTLLRYPIQAQRAQEAAIVPCPLDWTIVAPTRLMNTTPRGIDNIRLDTAALPADAVHIARGDVAAVLYRALQQAQWIRQRVYATW